MLVNEGPYPLLIEPPDGGFWIQNGEYDEALGEDGVWRAPEISTEHYSIQVDKTALVYGRNFVRQVCTILLVVSWSKLLACTSCLAAELGNLIGSWMLYVDLQMIILHCSHCRNIRITLVETAK